MEPVLLCTWSDILECDILDVIQSISCKHPKEAPQQAAGTHLMG